MGATTGPYASTGPTAGPTTGRYVGTPCPRRGDCMRRDDHRSGCSRNLIEAAVNLLRGRHG